MRNHGRSYAMSSIMVAGIQHVYAQQLGAMRNYLRMSLHD